MTSIYNVNFLDFVPVSLRHDEDIQALAIAIGEEINEITNEIYLCSVLHNVNILPDKVLDLLAWHYHVDFYRDSLPIEQKRKLILNWHFFHRTKGTPGAVETLINTIFGDGKVEEWFEYGAQPYIFKVVVNNKDATNEKAVEFIRAVDSVKNLRSHLEKVELSTVEDLNLYFAGIVHTGDKLTLTQVR